MWRYIDDIFMIWQHSREELCSFLEALNSFHETIKFTADINETSVNKSGTVYTIQIPPASEQSHINNIKPKRRTSQFNPYIPLTVDEALVTISNDECTLCARLNRLQVMKDLEISPSSSTSTITQDELPEEESMDITIPTIYGVYHTPKN